MDFEFSYQGHLMQIFPIIEGLAVCKIELSLRVF